MLRSGRPPWYPMVPMISSAKNPREYEARPCVLAVFSVSTSVVVSVRRRPVVFCSTVVTVSRSMCKPGVVCCNG
jgi:hypothetical protein